VIISRRVFAGGIVTVVLVASACSGGGDSKATPSLEAVNTTVASTAVTAQGAATSCPANSGLTGNVKDRGAAAATGSTLTIEAGDFFFTPTCETSVQSGAVTMVVKNTGQALHNVSIAAQNIDMDVAPGETITVQLKLDKDAVPYLCKYHRTSGMVGSLIPSGN
jgi:plastocyanin